MPIAYIDEVGYGAIFGELVACAIILPERFSDPRIRDSKQLKHKNVYALAEEFKEKIIHAFGIIRSEELNKFKNIYQANKLAMIRAIHALPEQPTVLFIDGKMKLEIGIDSVSIVKGDQKIQGIALASILAKDFRDHLMINNYGKAFEKYDIISNKGYKSPRHLQAIRDFGVTIYHRLWLPIIRSMLREQNIS